MSFKSFKSRNYVPSSNVPVGKWFKPARSTNNDQQKLRLVEVGANSSCHDNSEVSKKCLYTSTNYLGNKSMIRTQWRRHQRKKKTSFEIASKSSKS